MNAQVFYDVERMKLEDLPVPSISEREVLVKVKACGICGSDIAYYYGKSPLETESGKGPLVLGHEFSGEVIEVGAAAGELKLFKKGDRVVVNPVQHCNSCRMCARGFFNLCENARVSGVSVDGAFAEFAKTSSNNLFKLPENVSYEEAALIEPLSCATYAVLNANICLGDFVVVMGPGPIGLMMVQLAKANGAGRVALVGRRDHPLNAGKAVGADFVFNTKDEQSPCYTPDITAEIEKLTGSYMADRVMVATSDIDAAQKALILSGRKSTVVFFGLGSPKDVLKVPMLDTLTSDKRFVFSWLAPMVWPLAVKALGTGKVRLERIISHRFSLKELKEAFVLLSSGVKDKIKAVVVF